MHTQNAGFGLPSTFTWVEKYLKRDSGVPMLDVAQPLGNGKPLFSDFIWDLAGMFAPIQSLLIT